MRRVVVVLSAILFVSSCGRDVKVDYSQSGPPANTTTVVPPSSRGENADLNPVVEPQLEMPTKRPPLANPVQIVELSEYAIRMPTSIPPGKHSFRVMNAGTEKHNFEIEGNGVEVKLPFDLTRGDMKTIDVSLKPGTYEVYCPVDDHKGKGMKTTLTVK
jgi:hypothetical protein